MTKYSIQHVRIPFDLPIKSEQLFWIIEASILHKQTIETSLTSKWISMYCYTIEPYLCKWSIPCPCLSLHNKEVYYLLFSQIFSVYVCLSMCYSRRDIWAYIGDDKMHKHDTGKKCRPYQLPIQARPSLWLYVLIDGKE